MAWTAPATYSVSEIVLASKLNLHIRDNLNYLKGNAGAVAFADAITVAGTAIVTGEVSSVVAAGGSVVAEGTNNGSFSRFRLLTKRTSAVVVDWRLLANGVSDAGELVFYDATAAAERARFDNAGFFGIGTAAPQGKLHAYGAGGGVMFLSAAGVAGTLVTLAVAGTVQGGALFYVLDRNNTGGAIALASGNGLTLAQTFNIVNNDTITVSLTAGGAITVQRTVGTNGTHNLNMLVIYW